MSDPDYRYDPTRENPALNTAFTIGGALLLLVLFVGNCTLRVSIDSRPTGGSATAPVGSRS